MSDINAAWREQQRRRWLRPNAHLWMQPNAKRYLKPKPFVPKPFVPKPCELKNNADQAREFEHNATLDSKLAALRCELLLLRMERLRLKAGFNPDQPRDDQGRWTDSGGQNDRQVISDATPDGMRSGAQYAQNETQRRYSVNLEEEEARGGHTIREHVGKSDAELLASVRGDRGQAGIYRYARARHGSFESRESANDFVNRTLERNQELVDRVASGRSTGEFLNARFGYRTGREAFRPNIDSEPYLRDTYEAGVEIRHDPRTARGYRVYTAYPRNSRPQ